MTTSTRAPGGGVLDVVFNAQDDGTIRLSLTSPVAEGEVTSLRFKDCGHPTAETCDDDCDEMSSPTGVTLET
ncbi:hypothetical protein KN815_12420 [Streptomyces sp. 4503]|uniref:Uncharacterized protein n=1 Tax=Streptomyces niphimycinicus TaxID=2842201 RepID=A0ABS6CDB5_9ACTN|nr:hypothetical protein [Streptomyces niphimycinicus]MBU3864850.1 hypothetical protein [Streptomyces niphimycinicus]